MPIIEQAFRPKTQVVQEPRITAAPEAAQPAGALPSQPAAEAPGAGPKFPTHAENRAAILGLEPSGPQGILQGVRQAGETARRELGGLTSQFYAQAGAPLSFQAGRDTSTLLQAIDPTRSPTERAGAVERAQGLLGTTYQGPQTLQQDALANIARVLRERALEAKALTTGGGLAGAIKAASPGLTAGGATFEAQRLLQARPEIPRQIGREAQGLMDLQNEIQAERQRAEQYARGQTERAAQVGLAAREFLASQRDPVLERLGQRAAELNSQNLGVTEAYQRYLAAPTRENLLALDPYSPQDLSDLTKPNVEVAEARASYQDVIDRYNQAYPWMKDWPILEQKISGRGKTWYAVKDPKTGKVRDIRYIEGLKKEQRRALVARQKELEERFMPRVGRKEELEARYARIAPLYYGEKGPGGPYYYSGPAGTPIENLFEPEGAQTYLNLQEGTQATREMLATSDERTLVQNVNELLGEADRLEAANEPYRAAQIEAEVERYLENQEKALTAREEALDEPARKLLKEVQRIRRAHRKARRKKGATIGMIAGAFIPGLGGYPGTVGLGQQIGEEAAQ